MKVYTEENLNKMSVHTLRVILRSEFNGLPGVCNKNELIDQILKIQAGAQAPARSTKGRKPLGEFITPINNEIELADSYVQKEEGVVKGVVELNETGYGFLRVEEKDGSSANYFIPKTLAKRYELRTGDFIEGFAQFSGEIGSVKIQSINYINGKIPDSEGSREGISQLKPQYPNKKHSLKHDSPIICGVDVFCPIGKGQRCLIEDDGGKFGTEFIKEFHKALNEDVKTFTIFVGAKPEDLQDIEQTETKRVIVLPATSESEDVLRAVNVTFERAKILIENGEDAIVIIDSISSLASCFEEYSSSQRENKGFIKSNLTKTKLAKDLFSAGGCFGENKSLTVLAVCNSSKDEFLFSELSELATSVVKLKKSDVLRRRGYVVDLIESYTDKDELLLSEEEIAFADSERKKLGQNEGYYKELCDKLSK